MTPGGPVECPMAAAASEVQLMTPPRRRAVAAADTCLLSLPPRHAPTGTDQGDPAARKLLLCPG